MVRAGALNGRRTVPDAHQEELRPRVLGRPVGGGASGGVDQSGVGGGSVEVFSVANTEIQLGPDPATGAPVLRIQATPWGAHLAQVLADQAPLPEAGYYSVPHAALVDSRLMALVDVFIAARYAHPELLQLQLFSPGVP